MPNIKSQKGVTLLELLIACFLTFIIGAAALEFYSSQHNQWLAQNDVSDMQQNVRALMDELSRNIRSAGYGIMSTHPRIWVFPDTLMIFRRDSTKIDTTRYFVYTADTLHPHLVKQINLSSPEVFAENIESVRFVQAGSLVRVALVAREGRRDPELPGDGYRRRTLIADVELRNGT